jgi:hypothetical protein
MVPSPIPISIASSRLWQTFDRSSAPSPDALGLYSSAFGNELAQALSEYWRGALGRSDE